MQRYNGKNLIISSLAVYGLFDAYDYDVKISGDRIVIIGENGKGKSTILSIVYCLLTGHWEKIRFVIFDRIEAVIGEKTIVIAAADLKSIFLCFDYVSVDVSESIDYFLVNYGKTELKKNEIRKLSKYISKQLAIELQNVELYLVNLFNISTDRSVVMKSLEEIPIRTIKYDVLYFETSRSLRHWEGTNFVQHAGAVQRGSSPLSHLERQLGILANSDSQRIADFVSTCNDLLFEKYIDYSAESQCFKIYHKSQDEFVLDDENSQQRASIPIDLLSSGEQQLFLILAFSKLLLNRGVIIIDEPEVSMSLRWQRKLGQIISQLSTCQGIYIATQSPFTFENDLDSSAVYLKETYE